MGGSLTTPTGEYLTQTIFSDVFNHPGMAVHWGSDHLDKKADRVRVSGKGMYELFCKQKKVTLGTSELLKRLESICKDALTIIENIRSQKGFENDNGLRQYINTIMKEIEDELRAYNESARPTETKDGQPLLEIDKNVPNLSKESTLKISQIPLKMTDAFQHEDKPKTELNSQNNKDRAEEYEREIERLKNDNIQLAGENERQRKECAEIKAENDSLHKKIRQLEDEVKSLNTRLSKIASDKLSENNPAIADLSDANRPTKLGEQYRELYDNEWTDAFEALENNRKGGKEAIDILMQTLLNVSDFCSKKAELFLKETDKTIKKLFENEELEEKARNTMYAKDKGVARGDISMSDMQLYMKWEKPGARRHGSAGRITQNLSESQNEKMANTISSLRKEMGFSLLPLVKKAYLSPERWTMSCIPELEPYIKKCVQICWMMVVQRPPMCLMTDTIKGATKLTELWKPFTQSGTEIDFVVWPPLLLHTSGPLLANGVAQYKKIEKERKE